MDQARLSLQYQAFPQHVFMAGRGGNEELTLNVTFMMTEKVVQQGGCGRLVSSVRTSSKSVASEVAEGKSSKSTG